MTFRAKTAVKRDHRASYETSNRRTLYITLAFGLVVIVSLLILAGAAFASYYDDHFATIATVNGQTINKDDARARIAVESFRLDYTEAQIRSEQDSGRLDAASAQSQLTDIANAKNTVSTSALEDLIDARLQAQLAGPLGVSVTDQQVSDEVTTDATTPEARHVWIIGVKPKTANGETTISDADKAAAKAQADQALADLKAGKAWDDVAKANPDDVYSSKNGEVGFITKADNALDSSMVDPLFALPVNGLTDVIQGTDGEYRIGRVTEIDAQTVDPNFNVKLQSAGVSMDAYRTVARADALKLAINDKLVADSVNQPTVQRQVSEIFLASSTTQTGSGDEVQVRHILFSPNDDPNAASSVAATDPAWKKAEDEANAEYQKLLKDPSTFAADAKAMSDDSGTAADGGQLPYYTKTDLDPAFANAIFQAGLKPDEILPPVKSAFGWHVIQFMDRRQQPADRMKAIQQQLQAPNADFAAIAKASSEDPISKDNGGDIGWIAKNQLDAVKEIAIFKAPVGGLTDIIEETDGFYIYKVTAEQSRLPDPDQAAVIKANAFTNWYTAQKNQSRIERDYQTGTDPNLPTAQ